MSNNDSKSLPKLCSCWVDNAAFDFLFTIKQFTKKAQNVHFKLMLSPIAFICNNASALPRASSMRIMKVIYG